MELQRKRKKKRYLGMTGTQLGILGGAAAVALLLVCVLSWVMLSASAPASAQPTAVAATEIPSTPTLQVVESPTSLPATPLPEVATSVPPGGWLEFQTQGATLWLPDSFVGGDMVNKKQDTINKINALGKFYKNAVSAMKSAGPEVLLWAVDKTRKQTDIITTVTVEHTTSTEDTSVDEYIRSYLDSSIGGTPVAMVLTVNETKKMTLLGRDARRLIYSETYANHWVTIVSYYIKDGADIWEVDYLLIPDEYFDMLPVVEQSIHTFNLLK